MNKHTNGINGHAKHDGHSHAHTKNESHEGEDTMNTIEKSTTPAVTTPPAVFVPTTSDTNPSTTLIASMLTQLDAMASSLGTRASPLTIAGRQRLLKMKTGGGDHVQVAVKLAQRYGLAIPTVDPQAVASDAEFVSEVAMLVSRLDVVRGLVNDMSLEAQSRMWRAGTTAYTMLTRLVPQFPALQRELTPMASFLARQYKDAPTSLRKQEMKALQRRRSSKKAKAVDTGGAAQPASPTPAPTVKAETPAQPAPAPAATPPVAASEPPKAGTS